MFEALFGAAGWVVLPAWAGLSLSPWLGQRVRVAIWAVTGRGVPLVLGAVYLALLLAYWPVEGGGYGSLAAVRTLFGHDGTLLAGWMHFLAFDLFVGTWMAREGMRLGLPRALLVPCFLLAFWFGPVGLLAFFALRAWPWVKRAAGELLRRQPQLAGFGMLLLALLLPAAMAAWLDPRTLAGVDVWAKPMKFLAAIGLYALTLAWLIGELPAVRRHTRLVRAVVGVVLLTGMFEAVYITWQGALGQPSHFNLSTPFHAAMYSLMGLAALVFTSMSLPVAHQLWRHGDGMAPAYRLGAIAGLLLTFLAGAGMGVAISMNGGPWVGGAGGSGLPIVGWSTSVGDLRAPHFLGVHAQQLLPAAGWLLARGAGR
ncbi:ABA4-like family protein, partial [Bordetella petrii]|uniref:ABA4-like family protein n=1 Tax=Bordetella petrii TaxID=94624 RepID=UPI001E5E5245